MKTREILTAGLFLTIILLVGCGQISITSDLKLMVGYQKNQDNIITFTLTIRNEGLSNIGLVSGSSQIYDIEVLDSSGKEIWKWSYDKGFLCVITSITLQPGEQKVYQETWDLRSNRGEPVAPGTYRARAWLVTEPSASYDFKLTI